MSSPVVRLKIRVRLSNGSRAFLDPVWSGNQILKPLFAVVGGKPEHHPEGVYHLRYLTGKKRVWEAVGSDAQLAVISKLKREKFLAAKAAGVAVQEDTQVTGRSLASAVSEYLAETKEHKSEKTLAAYTTTLHTFLESCRKPHLEDLNRKDLLNYISFLRNERRNGRRTIRNRVDQL